MIHIILTILKVIGIILLVILGLLLLILLSVLLLPLKYGGRVEYDENNLYAVIKGRYLFGLLRFKAEFKNKKFKYYVKVLWKELLGNDKKDKSADNNSDGIKPKKAKKSKKANKDDISNSVDELFEDDTNNNVATSENSDNKENIDEHSIEEKSFSPDNVYYKCTDNEEVLEDKEQKSNIFIRFIHKIKSFFFKIFSIKNKILALKDKILFKILGFCDKLRDINKKKDEIISFVKQEDTKQFLRLVRHQVFLLFKHILPYKVKGRVKFGLDSPDKTGQALAVISIVKARYGKKINITPDFNQKIIEVNLKYNGRIRVINILLIALKIIRQKKLKEIIKMIKK